MLTFSWLKKYFVLAKKNVSTKYFFDQNDIFAPKMYEKKCEIYVKIDHLKIDKLLGVVGGSLGGFQCLEWATRYPDKILGCVPIASSPRLTTQGLAFDVVIIYFLCNEYLSFIRLIISFNISGYFS